MTFRFAIVAETEKSGTATLASIIIRKTLLATTAHMRVTADCVAVIKENNMAYECPNCGLRCHCNGDIDDICMDGPVVEGKRKHCLENDDDFEYDDWLDCETNQGGE